MIATSLKFKINFICLKLSLEKEAKIKYIFFTKVKSDPIKIVRKRLKPIRNCKKLLVVQDFQTLLSTILKLLDVRYFFSKKKKVEIYSKLLKITGRPGFSSIITNPS